MSALVYINGEIVRQEDAKISVFDRGFLFGDAVYEVTRSYGNLFFALEEHIDRLFRSAKGIQLEIPKTKKDLIKDMYELQKSIGAKNQYIRVQVSRGNVDFESINIDPQNASSANIVMYMYDFKGWGDQLYRDGIELCTSTNIRNSKKALDPNIKSGNYLNNIIGMLNKNSAKDAILLNEKSEVTEGSTFNFFIVKGNTVITCPSDFDILQGITRNIVFQLIKDLDLKLEQKGFYLEDVYSADEVFITSSTKEIMPVASLDSKKLGLNKDRPVIGLLQSAYKKYVNKYIEQAKSQHPWQ